MTELCSRALPLLLLTLSPFVTISQIPVHAPDGGTRERIQSITILPKTGAPFSAVVVTDWTRQLADGTSGTVKNHRIVARDSTGRIFQERRFFSPNGDKQATPLSSLEYADPNRHELYSCIPATHTCTVYTYNVAATVVPASPSSRGNDAAQSTGATNSTTVEDLGQRSVDNLDTRGSREITTLPAGIMGNSLPEPIVKEFWYSPRLEINLIVKRFDPRGGAQNFTVQNLNLAEPDPRLFVPPADYRHPHRRPVGRKAYLQSSESRGCASSTPAIRLRSAALPSRNPSATQTESRLARPRSAPSP
jgi:hypothetical protein